MKLTDLNTDCILRIIGQVSTETRLQIFRLVCKHWKKIVESLCLREKTLGLQIGTGNQWDGIIIDETNGHYTITIKNLTEELAHFLTSTFPRLQNLVVIIRDSTEDPNYLIKLPSLIFAYTHSLTNLYLFWDVKNSLFQTNFRPIITSINALHSLKRLSLNDASSSLNLQMPLFDLPLLKTLDAFELKVKKFDQEQIHLWSPYLQARKTAMKINLDLNTLLNASNLILSADVALHFNSYMFEWITSLDNLKNFCKIFTNLEKLKVKTFKLPLAKIITQLANLPHLVNLFLSMNITQLPIQLETPQLTNLKHLCLFLYSTPTNPHTYLETLNTSTTFPNVQFVELYLKISQCSKCGWKGTIFRNQPNDVNLIESYDKTTLDQIKQCLIKVASFHTKVFKIGIRCHSRFISAKIIFKNTHC